MTSRMGQQQSDGFLTKRNAWMEGKAPMPNDPPSIFETNFNNLLGLFLGRGTSILLGPERGAAEPVTIINKLSGKALEVENASINQAAHIHQVTRNGASNQRWFIKQAKFSIRVAIPAVMFREAYRFWPSFLRFPLPGYSLIATHSGLCLDILNTTVESRNGRLVPQPTNPAEDRDWNESGHPGSRLLGLCDAYHHQPPSGRSERSLRRQFFCDGRRHRSFLGRYGFPCRGRLRRPTSGRAAGQASVGPFHFR